MQLVALGLGILALVGMAIGFIPCFGWVNYINIPLSGIGLIFAIITLVLAKADEGKATVLTGLVLCVIAIVLGTIRLVLGGGVL